MDDFLASVTVLIFLFLGVASLFLLPITAAIRLPLRRSYTGDAWGKVLSDLVGVYFLVSLTAQLTQDHQNQPGGFTGWYPYILSLIHI